jgi:hypothetical protein
MFLQTNKGVSTVGKPAIETMVRVYKSPKDYEHDIKKLSKQGWTVLNSSSHQPQSGFVRTMSGMGLLGSKPKAEMIVTYQKTKR